MNSDPVNFVCTQCPNLWSMLNQKAQKHLPQGLMDFLSGEDAAIGQCWLNSAEAGISYLFEKLSQKEVADHYRRDLSGVNNENRLAELLCEIALAARLSKLSSTTPVIRPKNSSGTSCDVKVRIEGTDVYGESKRLEDRWFEDKRKTRRLISMPQNGNKDADTAWPRYKELQDKLSDCPRQFPDRTVNIVFVFHRSCGETVSYVTRTLLGDKAFSQNGDQIPLESYGLFATDEWQKISGCAYTGISENGVLSIGKLWQNPRAATPISEEVSVELKKIHWASSVPVEPAG